MAYLNNHVGTFRLKNSSKIKLDCARIDQSVTIALRIDEYSKFKTCDMRFLLKERISSDCTENNPK